MTLRSHRCEFADGHDGELPVLQALQRQAHRFEVPFAAASFGHVDQEDRPWPRPAQDEPRDPGWVWDRGVVGEDPHGGAVEPRSPQRLGTSSYLGMEVSRTGEGQAGLRRWECRAFGSRIKVLCVGFI